MTVFTVHISAGDDRLTAPRMVLVKDGFSWLAAALCLFATFGLGVPLVQFGIAMIIGLVANEGRRIYLTWRGLMEVGVVASVNKEQAEQRFLDAHPDLTASLLGPS